MFKKTSAIIALLTIMTAVHAAEIHEIEDSIKKHRTGFIVVQTTPNTTVHVRQLSHEFWFGAALSDGIFNGRASNADVQMYKEKFLENFNSAVTENALKWGNMEREKGKVNFATTDNILAWTDDNNIPLRGHNIYWGIPKRVQNWLKTLDNQALHTELHIRAKTIAARYQGRFAEYDLNNEMIHGNYYEDRLGPEITGEMVDWIKAIDPQAILYLNDYDVLTGQRLKSYQQHIKQLLDGGVRIDGIGVQGHLHGSQFNPDSLTAALDVLAQFNLPIRITEFNMPGQRSKFLPHGSGTTPEMTTEEEMQRAHQLTEYYRICFAHPAVEGILMWGFWEGANWIPASSLYKKDWTPTPAADAYRSLVFDEWWTDVEARSDKNGICTIRAYYGTHEIMADGIVKTIELPKNHGTTYVEVLAGR